MFAVVIALRGISQPLQLLFSTEQSAHASLSIEPDASGLVTIVDDFGSVVRFKLVDSAASLVVDLAKASVGRAVQASVERSAVDKASRGAY